MIIDGGSHLAASPLANSGPPKAKVNECKWGLNDNN
jgi:hypothetical protein